MLDEKKLKVSGSTVERIEPGTKSWETDLVPHVQRYKFSLPYLKGPWILDAACGVGYGCQLLAKETDADFVAFDLSPSAIEKAKHCFAHPRIHLVTSNALNAAFVNKAFNSIVAYEILEHVNADQFLREMSRLLAPDGIFLCSTPNRERQPHQNSGKPENPFHLKEYSPSEFRNLLNNYFEEVVLHGQHWSAAFEGAMAGLWALWSNPAVRLGRWFNRLRGYSTDPPFSWEHLRPTEKDLSISSLQVENAWTLLAVCRAPRIGHLDR